MKIKFRGDWSVNTDLSLERAREGYEYPDYGWAGAPPFLGGAFQTNYRTPLRVPVGEWVSWNSSYTGFGAGAAIMKFNLAANSTFTGTVGNSCSFTGEILPDLNNKNYRTTTLTWGAGCVQPNGTSLTGIKMNGVFAGTWVQSYDVNYGEWVLIMKNTFGPNGDLGATQSTYMFSAGFGLCYSGSPGPRPPFTSNCKP